MARDLIVPLETRLLEHRFPHECTTAHPYHEVEPWCRENFGEFNERWYRYGRDIAIGVIDPDTRDIYRFRDDKDAIMFKLKWS
jgi:hypothetical protein